MKIRGEWPRSDRRNLVRYKYVDTETGRTIVQSPRGIKDATEARQEMRDFEDAMYRLVRGAQRRSSDGAAKHSRVWTWPFTLMVAALIVAIVLLVVL